MRKQHYMTEQERHQLEAMRRNKVPVREIARQLGFCERTIYYELRRGSYMHTCDFWDEKRYSAQKGQQTHNYNQTAKGRPLKIGSDHTFAAYIEHMTITEKVTKQSKAGARSASLPSALPALQMPKLKTPAKTSGTQMPVLGKTTSKGVGIVQSVANGSGTQSSGRTTAPKVKTVKPTQQSTVDRAANIRAFGAGDYSGGGELLEKMYKTARGTVKGIGSSYANIGGSAVEGMGNLQETMQRGEYDKKVQQMKDNKAFYEQALKTGVNPHTGKKLTVDERSRYYKIRRPRHGRQSREVRPVCVPG